MSTTRNAALFASFRREPRAKLFCARVAARAAPRKGKEREKEREPSSRSFCRPNEKGQARFDASRSLGRILLCPPTISRMRQFFSTRDMRAYEFLIARVLNARKPRSRYAARQK